MASITSITKERKEAYISWFFIGVFACIFPPASYLVWQLISGVRFQNIPLDLGADYLLTVFSVSINTLGIAVESNKSVGKKKTTMFIGAVSLITAFACWGFYNKLISVENLNAEVGTVVVLVHLATGMLLINAIMGMIIKKWIYDEKEKTENNG